MNHRVWGQEHGVPQLQLIDLLDHLTGDDREYPSRAHVQH